MTRRAYLYFVITFLIGIVVGGAGMYYYAWSAGKWRHPFNESKFIHNWANRLNLSQGQVGKFRSVCDDTIKKRAAIDKEKEPELNALRQEWRDHIRQILTPQQVNKFNQVLEQHRRARQKRK